MLVSVKEDFFKLILIEHLQKESPVSESCRGFFLLFLKTGKKEEKTPLICLKLSEKVC